MIELDRLPRFTLRDLRELISSGLKDEKTKKVTVSLDGRRYVIVFRPLEYEVNFLWEDDEGQGRHQRIYIVGERSNLKPESYVWYFVCPHTGKKCRTLYTDGKVITSRHAFQHTYSSRNKSHKWREMEKIFRGRGTEEDLMKFRKSLRRKTGIPRKHYLK